MSSQLNVDTIVDKAGSGGTNVKIGNTSTYVSDGGAVTQNTVQGLAKAWTFTTDNAVNSSYNTSALTDHGTGDYSFTITSVMSNDDFSVTSNVAENIVLILFNISRATNNYRIGLAYIDGNKYDKNSSTVVHGDLA